MNVTWCGGGVSCDVLEWCWWRGEEEKFKVDEALPRHSIQQQQRESRPHFVIIQQTFLINMCIISYVRSERARERGGEWRRVANEWSE